MNGKALISNKVVLFSPTKHLPSENTIFSTCKCRNIGANIKCREPLDDYANFHLFGESSNSDLPVNRVSTLIINCNMHTDKSNNYIEQI